ncbi:hypothetical protein PG994_008671 [Apiospora phragmitis]|uniref:Uncharacterized protein n=1 Tax=Apiospora phragmitis TaxID=2905665 RepID=A0ABR1UH64_9PEZI
MDKLGWKDPSKGEPFTYNPISPTAVTKELFEEQEKRAGTNATRRDGEKMQIEADKVVVELAAITEAQMILRGLAEQRSSTTSQVPTKDGDGWKRSSRDNTPKLIHTHDEEDVHPNGEGTDDKGSSCQRNGGAIWSSTNWPGSLGLAHELRRAGLALAEGMTCVL